jgi:predicted YcjX-like family ATPase
VGDPAEGSRRGTVMPERAEIEAVESVIAKFFTAWMTREDRQLVVREIIAALDRVRDARGDDELSDEQLDAMRGREDPRVAAALPTARSPQGEDHERS